MAWMRYRTRSLKFTHLGKYFVVLCLGVGFAAINTGNNLLYLILGMMLAMIIASGILSERTLRGINIERIKPQRLFAATPSRIEIILTNKKKLWPSFSIVAQDMIEPANGNRVASDSSLFALKIPANQGKFIGSYFHTFPRRGKYTIPSLELRTRFPFSFFEKTRHMSYETEVLVYPNIENGRLIEPTLDSQRSSAQDSLTSPRLGRYGDFYGLREYREGDPARSIYWRKSANLGELVVREQEDTAPKETTIFLDNYLGLAQIDTEKLVSQAAYLASLWLEKGFSVEFVSRTALVPKGTGANHLDQILSALATLEFVKENIPFAKPYNPQIGHVLLSV